MAKRIFLLSKDAFGKFYLPIYGNKYWKTPNIDELANKGTVFNRHYASAASSAMSYYGMFTGQWAMNSKMSTYHPVSKDESFKGDTLFDKAFKLGFECHIIWDKSWQNTAKIHSECYGKHTIFHPLDNIKQSTGVHAITGKKIERNDEIAKLTCEKIENCIKDICSGDKDVFIWMHLPQVYNGRTGYGSDIDLLDSTVGIIRKFVEDENIFITADHGNMNGTHGKLAYGFDVNETVINVPFITPRIEGLETVDFPTSHIDLFPIIFNRDIPKREFIYSDSAYYAQLHRKLAIIHGRYKLIFSAEGKKEELYDVVYDPNETQNLINDKMLDVDRGLVVTISEMYFYPLWDNVENERLILREELNRVWKNPNPIEYLRGIYEKYGKRLKRRYKRLKAKLKA